MGHHDSSRQKKSMPVPSPPPKNLQKIGYAPNRERGGLYVGYYSPGDYSRKLSPLIFWNGNVGSYRSP